MTYDKYYIPRGQPSKQEPPHPVTGRTGGTKQDPSSCQMLTNGT